jgi:hypothetical protein
VIVLAPDRGQPLVQTYQPEETLRQSIPHSDLIEKFPPFPFVGELGYADISRVLMSRSRFLSRTERNIVEELLRYLDFKHGTQPR